MARAVLATWCAVIAVTGCHSPTAPPVRPEPAPTQLPVTRRTPVEPTLPAVAADSPVPTSRPAEYRRLTAAECRTLAVANAPFASDLDHH